MPADHIVFNADQYSRLITELVELSNSLSSAVTSGSTPLSPDVRLQPDTQIWQPAIDLVTAGKGFFSHQFASVNDVLLPELTNLCEGMARAKASMEAAGDLAAMMAGDFNAQLPHLSARIPADTDASW